MNESIEQAAGTELASLTIASFANALDETTRLSLGDVLPGHVAARRWFRAKTKTIRKIEIEDVLPVAETAATVLIIRISYTDPEAEEDRYILPLSIAPGSDEGREEVVVKLRTAEGEQGVLFSALDDDRFRDALLTSILCEWNIAGQRGSIYALRTKALLGECPPAVLKTESFVSRAEQSNTSVIYRGSYILKLFRKLEAGINPDLEIGKFLTEHGFRNTPAVLGSLEYRSRTDEAVYGAGILQQFVPNQGDAWKYTLDSLQQFFGAALTSKRLPSVEASKHPLDLIGQGTAAELRSYMDGYLESAALLGKRTAEMHGVLASDGVDRDFRPELFSGDDGHQLQGDLVSQARTTFGVLRLKRPSLDGVVRAQVDTLLGLEETVQSRNEQIGKQAINAHRIRHHGDYHLGQVLYTGNDFMIIDFEGEPARPLEERRKKSLALRDVAGMLRSFHYAAYSALFGQIPGIPSDEESRQLVEEWAAAWYRAVSAVYLKAYFEEAGTAAFVPAGWQERRVLLDAFLLQKALYEVAYELNNRPGWLQIPVRGILDLMS